ncbi:MAG: hypothetical protein A2283_00285 [Lentisphaerae bacterium RIFOXYA12_FULL_48_11]|nr:MAG: hypothetical protein A2283_00285 [Lentisphaerae bacterium RIFOXYA12_FULL_48_11]
MHRNNTAFMLTLLVGMFIASDCFAQKLVKNKPKHDALIMSGIVKLVKDKDGNVCGINMTAQDGTIYKVTTNDAAKTLNDKDGQSVDLSGCVEEMDGQKWFTIASEKSKAKGQKGENKGKRRNK